MAQTLYVNPSTGSDSNAGTESAPFKTIAHALGQAQSDPDTEIRLSVGNYNADSGESFPLEVPSGVKIIGNEGNKGSGIVIEGSGQYTSPTQSRQSVALRLDSDTELRGVSLTNGERRGTAVWIESANPTVINCTFTKSNREGIFAAGSSKPKILNNQFIENNGQGISITRNSAGEIRGNTCKQGGAGIVIDGEAIPQVIGNECSENRYGMQISQDAKPVLRKNRIENNSEEGISLTGKAFPDLGSSDDPGENIFSNNAKLDIGNYTKNKLLSVGNSLNSSKVKGEIEIKGGSAPTQT
ncbi:MAG: DUF1565 domain-containing protein, partial [Symploca sp. SIO1C4]|nr:DUF1565 domain-containing protein [Symploca sp. SIO1C4]